MLQQILSRTSQSSKVPESKQGESPNTRYATIIQGLMHEAYQQKSVAELVNVLAWALAGVAHDFGPTAIADILARLGGHMRQIVAEAAAQAEADAARRAGVTSQ